MGKYHNKLDKKYFNKSIYMRRFESAFNIKIKDYPLQYELVYETYNTIISLNNMLFSLNYVPLTSKIDNILHLLNSYLNKHNNKIKKCYDSNCILLYDNIESIVNEVILKKEGLDKRANTYLINWEINRLNKVDQAIFEIAIYELLYTDTPKKVVIDEAIELSKKYSEDAVVKMLNGVLDKIYHEEDKDAE